MMAEFYFKSKNIKGSMNYSINRIFKYKIEEFN
jgi:hypothetical protein